MRRNDSDKRTSREMLKCLIENVAIVGGIAATGTIAALLLLIFKLLGH